MSITSHRRPGGALFLALLAIGAATACGGTAATGRPSTPAAGGPAPAAAAPMPAIKPSERLASLSAHGIDVAHAGSLNTLRGDARDMVMQSFTDSLNVRCTYCHVDGDFAAPTERKAITEVMWDRFVHGMKFKDASAGLYCDSCHQRAGGTILDRHDDDALGDAMRANFVEPLAQADGQPAMCSSCHGRPFQPRFLPRNPGQPASPH